MHSKGRLLMVLLIVVAIGLQWFCWSYRHPTVTQRRAEIRDVSRLEDEVEKLERRWSEEDAAEVDSRLQQVRQHLFVGAPEPGGWSEEVEQPDSPMAMAARVSLGDPIPHPRHSNDLLIVPTEWTLDLKSSRHPDYSAILEFLQNLTTDQAKRMDLVSITASGDGRSLTNVELGIDLWFQKEMKDTP